MKLTHLLWGLDKGLSAREDLRGCGRLPGVANHAARRNDEENGPKLVVGCTFVFVVPVLHHESRPGRPTSAAHDTTTKRPSQDRIGKVRPALKLVDECERIREAGRLGGSDVRK